VEYFNITLGFGLLSIMHYKYRVSTDFRYIFVLLLFVFGLLIGLRGNQDEYTRIFVLIPDFSSFDHLLALEKGYVLYIYSSILKTIGLGSQYLLMAYALLSISLYSYYYRKFTPYFFLAFLIYMVHALQYREMHGIRMGLASALALPIMKNVLVNKNSRYFLLSFLSVFIHYVGVLSFLIYYLNRRFSLTFYFLSFSLAIIIAKTGVLVGILEYIRSLEILPNFISNYIVDKHWSYDAGLFHFKTMQQISFCILYLFLVYRLRIKTDNLSNLIFNMYFMSTILYVLFSQLAIFAFRLGSHFYVVEPLLIVMMINMFKEKRAVYMGIVFVSMIVSYVNYVYLHKVEDYLFMIR
jgi:amylovoran biosynthesis protein AmsC